MEAAPVSTRRVKSPAQDLVRQMRAEGLSDRLVRAQLGASGFSKSRISQLLHAVPCHQNVRGYTPLLQGPAVSAKQKHPPITSDELRHLGEASALEALRQLERNNLLTSARLSCEFLGVSIGGDAHSSTAPVLRTSTLVYVWRLAAMGFVRVAIAKKSARFDAIDQYVPLPAALKNILQIDAHYDAVLREARRILPTATLNLRLGIPKKLEPPSISRAPGATVVLQLPSGKRVEHVLCARVYGDVWYCHAGSPEHGDLSVMRPFRIGGLVLHDLTRAWHPRQAKRKRLRGRCVKRDLAAAASKHWPSFERLVAVARWKAERERAKKRGMPMLLDAATAGVDFTEKAFEEAGHKPWTSTILAVWQWAAAAPQHGPHTRLGGDVHMQYSLRNAPYRIFGSMPRLLIPCEEFG